MKTVSSSTTLAATSGCQGPSLPRQEPLRVSLSVFLRAFCRSLSFSRSCLSHYLGGRGILLEWPLEANLEEDKVSDQGADAATLNLSSTFYF